MERWTIDLVEKPNKGISYAAEDLLDKLDPKSLERLSKQQKTYTKYSISDAKRLKIIKSLKNGIWRLGFTLPKRKQIRFLGSIETDSNTPTFKVYCAFIKKDQTIKQKYIKLTINRIKVTN